MRDYEHVRDVADGLVAVLEADVTGAIAVSSGLAATLRDIVLSAGRLAGRPELIQQGAFPARATMYPRGGQR